MGKPKAPEAPDYAAAAVEQGKANVQSAIATNYLNQADQIGPTGSRIYSYDPTQMLTLPDGTQIPKTTATTTLSPEQQRLYDQNIGISTQLNDLAARGIGYVDKASGSPIDMSKLPGRVGSVAPTALSGTIGATGIPLATTAGTTGMQTAYDWRNVTGMPSTDDYTGDRDRITAAMLERMQPQFDRDREQTLTRLANQGINRGSEAYDWDNFSLDRSQNDFRIAALLAGNKEQQDLFNNTMGVHQQGINEGIAQGNFANKAANDTYAQMANNAALQNQAAAMEFAREQAKLEAANTAATGTFNQGLASGQFANQARAQALQEEDYLKNQPLNMLNALRTGNQVSMPQFGNVSGGSNIQAAPLYSAAQDQYAAEMANYQAQLAARGSLLGGLGSLGSAAIGAI